jgi:cation diffusion facilitator CzcD-associated flavoprotein CzcO
LHTHKQFSALPYLSFPKEYPAYPSRLQVAEYLDAYARTFHLRPLFDQDVERAAFSDGLWMTTTSDAQYLSRHLVVATGYSSKPLIPTWPGQATFSGPILHSSIYDNGAAYTGQRVLVVGFGNSGGEIAIDLHEHGAEVSMAVRSPVNVVPRDLFGVPTHILSVLLSKLPPELADALSGTLRKAVVGDLRPYGLEPAAVGPMTQMKRTDQVPLLDIGTVELIKQEVVRIEKGIDHFDGSTITFSDGRRQDFDAVILATGYSSNLADFLEGLEHVTDESGKVIASGGETALPGLFFCGLYNARAGLLRQIGAEARRIARLIQRRPRSIPAEMASIGDVE